MDLDLTGRVALVTGSTGGIGAAVARVLAAEGAAVIIHGRNEHKAAAVTAEISNTGGSAAFVVGELGAGAAAEQIFQTAERRFGRIDILVNNAGSYSERAWFDTTAESWRELFAADVVPAVGLTLLAVPAMKTRGWGRIIQIATEMATSPRPVMADYAAAKAALVNMTVSLAKALSGTGITSNTVSPGLIATEGVERVLAERAARDGWGSDTAVVQRRWLEEVLDARYTKRLGTPDEVAALVAFVASPQANYINGANLRIDGGLSPAIN
jgi:3-oxoacyl-[acyl-carrier protein] reductase